MNSCVLELFHEKNGIYYEFLPNLFEVRHD